jgi:hypothetical protein
MKKISLEGTSGHAGIAVVREVQLATQQFGAVGIVCNDCAVQRG